MGMHNLGHMYKWILTAYQFIHAPLDLHEIKWKLVLGVRHAFRHLVVCPCRRLACRGKSSKPGEEYGGRICIVLT